MNNGKELTRMVGLVLTLGIAGIAQSAIVFNDTCDQDVRNNWTDPWGGSYADHGVNAVTWNTGKYVCTSAMGELHTIADFPGAANGYTLSYTDLLHNQGTNYYWTVSGPGGPALATESVGHPAKVIYNGTEYALDAPVYGLCPTPGSENSVTIQYDNIASDQHRLLITLTAGGWRDTNGNWHNAPPSQVLFDHTFTEAPDFATYGSKITMTVPWRYSVYDAQIDNVVLDVVPEPATLGLFSLGILGLLRRKA